MFRLPSWIPDSRGRERNLGGDEVNIDAGVAPSAAGATLPDSVPLKRRREASEDVLEPVTNEEPETKRRRLQDTVVKESFDDLEVLRAREAIETQFSLETLLKHNELRLIQQELAKCQIALEQLRRCHLIPYPATEDAAESMLNVMQGTGPAVAPKWAPPYGVVDGPYSRHYATFLKPDPRFDGIPIDQDFGASHAAPAIPEGRSTRNNSMADGNTTSRVRASRYSTGHKLQALSSGYSQPKMRNGPCILKRAADGQTVKLVCVDCHREDFSSTQGFINHCRIAHHRDYKSHEEAAVGCGQVLELDESGGVLGGENASAASGLVHRLIRNTPTDRDAYKALLLKIDASVALYRQGKLPGVASIPTIENPDTPNTKSHSEFIPSADTPHLSKLLRNKGFAGNLEDMVTDSRTRTNLEAISPNDAESDGETPTDISTFRYMGGFDGANSPTVIRVPARTSATDSQKDPQNSSGKHSKICKPEANVQLLTAPFHPIVNITSTHYAAPSHTFDYHNVILDDKHVDGDIEMHVAASIDLSLNTVSSNNAPSLVSDDGEYDDGSENETSRSDIDEDDSDVAEINIEDGDVEKIVPRVVMRDCGSGNGAASMRLKKEDKHVTFVSPVKEGQKEKGVRR